MTEPSEHEFERDVVVVGGCGHVGLPLAVAFADRGARVVVYDVSEAAVALVNAGSCRSMSRGRGRPLARAVAAGRLRASADPAVVGTAEHVVVVIGTPVDEHLNPNQTAIPRALSRCAPFLRDGQLLVLRSTVFPGVTALVEKMIAGLGVQVPVAFCPERIAEGKAMTELFTLPQIVSARSPQAARRAAALFSLLAARVVELSPEEAELAKLFTNTWRYIKFAAANQFYMMANDQGLDFERIRARAERAATRCCRGHARRRVRRRALFIQGHHAARRLREQQLRPRPHRDDRQRGACHSTSHPASRTATTSRR